MMSMEITTAVEYIQVAFVYLLCCFFAPHIVFHKHLKGKELSERFLLCIVISNFYIINIVFIILLLKLPYSRMGVILISVIPALIAWQRINRPKIRQFFSVIAVAFSRFMLGEAKIKTIWGSLTALPKQRLRHFFRRILSHILHHLISWLSLLGLLGFSFWYHSYASFHKYAYGAPDMIVHHYWIHVMDHGEIFIKGIYPHGFHNLIFFMHRVFNVRIVTFLRVFGAIETLVISLMIYLLLKKICHSHLIPLIGLFFFTVPDLFVTMLRYQFALPQEYAMVFLYPCAYYLIQYFERKKKELASEKEYMRKNLMYAWLPKYQLLPSTRSLIFFGMSFSLTIAVHFYITIVAVFLCLAIAIAYVPIVFHYRYFFSIAVAGILSLSAAVAPMALGYLQGRPLQGSLYWALGSMSSGKSDSEESEDTEDTDTAEPASSDGTTSDSQAGDLDSSPAPQEPTALTPDSAAAKENFLERIGTKLTGIKQLLTSLPLRILRKVNRFNENAVLLLPAIYGNSPFNSSYLWITEGTLAVSLLLTVLSRKYYCRNILAMELYYAFTALMIIGQLYSLPSLMDWGRASIFIAYATPLMLACAMDMLYSILFRPLKYPRSMESIPLGLLILFTYLTVKSHFVRPLSIMYAVQRSGEMYCDYRIMKEYPEKRWTIVTTTNSIEIVSDDGWHTEVFDFLREMENFSIKSKMQIPTKYVFFYIEKYPINVGVATPIIEDFSNSGHVSEEGAQENAVFGGSSVYFSHNRYVLESKMYYWAKAFEAKYPKEFQVFYEDDTFICYRLVQNEYQLYNFAIDYGFNSK